MSLGLLRRPFVQLVFLAAAVAFAATACGNNDSPATTAKGTADNTRAGAVTVDVVYVSHIPGSNAVVDEITRLFGDTPGVTVSSHDVITPDGQAFATARNVNARFVVLINGKAKHTIDGRDVSFTDFPGGRGTSDVPAGKWTLDELRALAGRLILGAS